MIMCTSPVYQRERQKAQQLLELSENAAVLCVMVPRRGLEPPRLAALLPESSASTNSAIWAGQTCGRMNYGEWPPMSIESRSCAGCFSR